MTIKEQIISMKNELPNMTIGEVAKKLNCDYSHVGKTVKAMGISCKKEDRSKYGFMIKAGHRKARIQNLTDLEYTNQEICLLTDENQKNLIKYKHNHGIKTNFYKNIKLTNMQEQIIIGSTLGDAYLAPSTSGKTSCIVFKHSTKQAEYLKFKRNCLTNLMYPTKRCSIRKPRISNRVAFIESRKIESECMESESIHHPVLLEYREKFYPNGVKIIPEDLFEKLDAFGIAIWFMDDGCKMSSYDTTICTNSFTKDDVQMACDVLKRKFDLNCHVHTTKDNHNLLKINASSSHDFRRLIEPYIIPSMGYKLYKNELLD